MKTLNRILATAIAAAGLLGTSRCPRMRNSSAAEAARLGADLTPMGAEKAGNKDGTIPGLDRRAVRAAGRLDAGQGLRRPVRRRQAEVHDHQGQRRAVQGQADARHARAAREVRQLQDAGLRDAPDGVLIRTRCTRTSRRTRRSSSCVGFGITGGRADVPFPIPKSGIEAIYNHQQRYLGPGVLREYNSFPVRANGDFYKIGAREYRIFNTSLDQPQPNLLLAFQSAFTTPATLEGTMFLVHEPVDQVKQTRSAWIYNAGQRRVRRAPDLAHDNFTDGTEGMRTSDQFDAWNGAPDRYDWKLVGKKEIYVPYNAYKLSDKKLKYKTDIIQQGHDQCRPHALRTAPRVGGGGHPQAGQQAHLRQAGVLPRRGFMVGDVRRRL